MARRLDCCHPYLRWVGMPRGFVWSHSRFCMKSTNLNLTDEELNRAVPKPGWVSEREQDALEARRLRDYGCSLCGVTQLPHLEDCPTNPYAETGQEHAPLNRMEEPNA